MNSYDWMEMVSNLGRTGLAMERNPTLRYLRLAHQTEANLFRNPLRLETAVSTTARVERHYYSFRKWELASYQRNRNQWTN